MGLVGSGTNNARLAGMLRNLAQFYHKEPSDLFLVRLAQVSTSFSTLVLTGFFHSYIQYMSEKNLYIHVRVPTCIYKLSCISPHTVHVHVYPGRNSTPTDT